MALHKLVAGELRRGESPRHGSGARVDEALQEVGTTK